MFNNSNNNDNNFFDDFINEMTAANLQSQGEMSVVEFANRIIFNNDPDFVLYPTQRAILKSFYKETLTEEETSVLKQWLGENRTSWVKDRKYISLVLEAGRRSGKALDLNTLIATPTGYKLYKNIHPGDYVFTPDGVPTKVLAETEIFKNKKCYKLTFQNGETINCSEDHEWLTWDRAARKAYGRSKNPIVHPQIRTTQEIVDTLYIKRSDSKIENNHSISLTKPLQFTEQKLLVHPYCLGLFLGDGHYKTGIITSSKEDIDFVRNKFHELGYPTELIKSSYPYRFKSKKLNKQLKELNIFNKKEKIIPENYIISSIEQRTQLLQGLMDSDGYVDKKGHAYFTNTNFYLANLVYKLALSLGCAASKSYGTGTYKNNKNEKIICKDYIEVSLRPEITPVSLPRKVLRYKPCTAQNNKRFIVKAEKIDSIPVKCITIEDPNHLFLIGEELIPTHNCNSISAIIPTTKGDITYGELHNRLSNKEDIGIYTYNLNNNIVNKYITYDIKTELNKVEQTYIIKTSQGRQEIVNEEHPFLTWDDKHKYPYWKKLKDLKVRDYVAVSKSLPIFGEEEIEDNLLEAYAIKLTTPKQFIENDRKRLDYLKLFFKNGLSINEVLSLEYPSQGFFNLTESKTKFFLSCILKYANNWCLLLKVSSDEKENKKVNETFYIRIYLEKYLVEISNLFLKFGINFIVDAHTISIHNTTSQYTLLDTFGDICYNYPNLRKKVLNKRSFYLENASPLKTLNKNKLKEKAIKENDSKLLDWATNDINWERIKSIEPYKIEQTIALEVADTNVIGSYIISHNSTMASIVALKEFYDLIILDNPHKKYGIIEASPIAILVMAQSQAQVKETIFAAIRGYANNSRFFTSLQNKGIIEILSEEIRCPVKNVSIYAKHTNSKSLVGYTLKCMLLDEVARFDTIGEEGKNKAFEIWENVAAGGSTFGYDFKKVAISSAWEPNDPIEILYNRAQKDPNTLAFKLTTFQVNLKLQKGITPVIVSDYTNDYIKARREYEGIRFNKFNTFIDIENLNKAATSVSIIDAIPCEIDTKTNAGEAHYAGIQITRIAENEAEDGPSFIHVDPALKKDSAALAIARAINNENKWKIQVDALIKWEPHTDNNGLKRIVSFIDIEDKLNEISKIRRIGKVTFDQWNSASLIQKLQANGIDAQIASCSRENQFTYYTLFRDLLAHDYIILPKDSLWTNSAITELSELVLRPNKQIIHPTAGKDIADAIVNAVYQCHQHMIRTGLTLNMGINTNVVASQSLAPLQRINITTPTKTKEQLKIGSAIDKLYNIRKKLK